MKLGPVRRIGVVGSGQMGRGIAQVAAQSGFDVIVFDLAKASLELAQKTIQEGMSRGVTKGKWDDAHVKETLGKLSYGDKLNVLKDVDLVIEAVSENKTLKKDLFRELDATVKKEAILASNTSSISITELAAVTKRPKQFVGMHFMNPVPVMKLVEGIRGLETDPEVFDLTRSIAEKMGKVFISVNDVAGFAINRILMPMINEAVYALYEGVASAKDIDTGMKLGTNQPMGPLELADFIGLDTCLSIMEVLHEGLGDTKYRPCPLLKKYVAANRFGRKNGRGFYEYA